MFTMYSLLITVLLFSTTFSAPVQDDKKDNGDDIFGFDADLMDLIEDEYDDETYSNTIEENPFHYGSLESFQCDEKVHQCKNDGKCTERKMSDHKKILLCQCSKNYLGAYCSQSRTDFAMTVRTQPKIKDSFRECMKQSDMDERANQIFSACSSQDADCWYTHGGIEGINCFYWVIENALKVGIIEENPSEESRMQIYSEVFRKLASRLFDGTQRERQKEYSKPVYNVQVSFYNYGRPPSSNQNSNSFRPESPTGNVSPYTSPRFQPLQITIDGSIPSRPGMQLEDRNVHPDDEFDQPTETFLSHITDPYSENTSDIYTYENFQPFGDNQESAPSSDDKTKRDE